MVSILYIYLYHKQKQNIMKNLKKQIELTAKESNCSELEIIGAMQTELAKKGDEKNLEILCELKWDYIKL